MSFLRALSSDSLSGNSKSTINQAQSPASNNSSANHHTTQPAASQTLPTGGGHRRHHAKALLHPMSLLLRRRSGQSNQGSSESSPGSYGLARDLPDDFDPGIIYGTRHPDWSFPRRSVPPQTNSILRPESRVQSSSFNSGTGSSSQKKDPSTENTHPRKRQAFFTEHFSDFNETRSDRQEHGLEETSLRPNASEASDRYYGSAHTVESNVVGSSLLLVEEVVLEDPADIPESQSVHAADALAQVQQIGDKNEIEERSRNPLAHYSDIALDPLQNSSRFSFEASSAAESVHGEELTLSESLVQKSLYQPRIGGRRGSYDTTSFSSDDIQSITSDDLRDEDGDGFTAPFSDFPQSIAPPPGFESIVVDALENARRLQQIGLDENIETNLQPMSPNGASICSSEIGVNGSTTEEDEGGLDSNEITTCPPFVNPPGVSNHKGLVAWGSEAIEVSSAQGVDEVQSSPILTFHNIFQTAAQGVNEYDSGSPSFLGFQSLRQPVYDTLLLDEEAEIGDEDDMIAEANRDALASDSDGWYGQEFGFYPSSSTNSTYLAGGFFGIDLPKPGFIRNPSLTPISERSEGSLRNSLSLINPNSVANGGVSAGPLSTALFKELAKSEQFNCDETTLNQLQLLGGAKHTEEKVKHLAMIGSGNSNAVPIANTYESPRAAFPDSQSPADQLHSPFAGLDDPICHHSSDISTSYVHDTDLGWVMEKRRGGELIQRELVQGAV